MPALPHFFSYEAFGNPFPDPFSSRWCRHLFWPGWIMVTNGSLVGIPLYQLERLQSVINSSARLVFSSWRYDHITYPAPPPAALAQSTGAGRLEARLPRLQVSVFRV